jgi:diguanylate cyclase (GGDEF)-like protein
MQRDEAAAPDHLVVGMRREHEQPFAAEQRRFVRNRLRLNEHGGIVSVAALYTCPGFMQEDGTREELARLKAEHRQISDLLVLIQELTSRAVRSDSPGDLFSRAFPILHRCVPFDAGATVMLEQNLDLYVTTREGAESLVNEQLIGKIRGTLEKLIPVSFASTEVVVRAELHDIPAAGSSGLQHEVHALLEQEHRTAGMLQLYRGTPEFTPQERQVLAIFATQVSMLLDTIRAREKIANLADTDELTGIWNKRYFRRQLPQELERARTFNVPLSLLLFDIDDFKQINDGFGHIIGDVVLSELCGAVRESLRPTDVVARFGGDEFAIILPHTDARGAAAVANRVLGRVRALTIPTDEEGAIQCSVSIGIAEFEPGDATANDLIRRADERLYQAKREGKNRYTA